MVSDGYTHWLVLQVVANTLVSVAPMEGWEQVYVAPTVRKAIEVLSRGDTAAMPVIGDNLQSLRAALGRAGVVV